jgi:hypothetical protein
MKPTTQASVSLRCGRATGRDAARPSRLVRS